MRKVHGWRRVARWAIGILGGFVGLVALVVVVAFIVFSTGWGRGILRNQIATRLDKAFVGGASIGRVDGNPLSEVVLHDVVINGPDKKPAITVKRLTVKLPLLPLISRQLRVEKVIAEDLEVRAKKLGNGEYNLDNLMNKSEPSTWSVYLPNLEVHRGHVLVQPGEGAEPIDIDNIEVNVDAALPFAGPMSANAFVTGQWRQKRAPISIGAVIHGDAETLEVRNAGVQIGDVRALALGVKVPKGAFAKPFAGTIAVSAPAKAVHDLAPSVRLPDDIALSVTARPAGRLTAFTVAGAIGKGEVSAFGSADVQAKLASVVVAATDLNLTKLTNGTVIGRGGGFAALKLDLTAHGELPMVAGIAHAWPVLDDTPPLELVAAIDSAGDRIRATVGAVSDNGIRAGADATVRKRGQTITLEHADLIANTLDIARASLGKAPLRGVLSANLHAEGELAPRMDLAVAGHANGRKLRMAGASAQRLVMRIDAKHLPSHPAGSGRVELLDVQRGDLQFSNLTIAAGNRPDGKLQVTVRSQPKPAPWRVDFDALVTTGDTIVVDLQRHFVRAAGGSTWTGNTGRVTIGPRNVELRNFKSSGGNGTIAADASYVRAGRGQGDLAARVDASLDLGNLMTAHKGHLEAHVDAKRANGRFTGTVVATGKGVKLDPKWPVAFDGDVKIEARDNQIVANAGVSTPKSGSVAFALDVDAPRDISNVRAWRRLDRNAIRTAKLTVKKLDLAMIAKLIRAPALNGNVNGSLELSPVKASGTIAVRGVQTQQTKDLGSITADLKVAQDGAGELKTTLTAKLEPDPNAVAAKDITKNGQAHLLVDATFRTPDRIFDPVAWKRLGPNAFGGATLRAERLAFEPGTLERLGIVASMRGELAVGADVDPGMKSVRFSINLYQLRGGLFAQPIAVSVVGAVDEQSTRANADVRGQGVTLLHASTEIPVTLDQLRRDAQSAKSAPLSGQVRIDHVPAKALMNVIGTSQITGGSLDGTIDLGGTVAAPTVDAKLVAQNVTVPEEGTREVQQIKQLTIAAKWDGTAGNVAIDSDQTGGGKLTVRAAGAPSDLDNVSASIKATKVDIAPLVAFMPGPAGGLAGRLDADFALRGANPRTADLAGSLHVTDGRIPIAPTVGTLFRGEVKLDVKNKNVGLDLKGKLGRGDVALTAKAPLEGISPNNGEVKLTVRNVQLIGKTEPILTGTVDANIARIGDTWRSQVRVTRMTVKVPAQSGTELKPVGAPKDLVFGGEKIHHGKHKGLDVPEGIVKDETGPADFKPPSQVEGPGVVHRKLPSDPALVAYIQLRNVFVESDEVRGLIGGHLTLSVANNQEVGVVGDVNLSRGVLELFSRRYDVDKAALHFDGSTDPIVDVRISHDFREVTTITEVWGRLSNPQLNLSSTPARYTQAELLGFLLGGEPGGDPENAPSASERVAGAGASIIGNKIGGYVKRALPVDIDVLRYEAATSMSSAAVTVGTWITDTLFLAYRHRLEARPDENAGEGEIEYWIRRRLVIQGVVGDRSVNGADLLWRRRW